MTQIDASPMPQGKAVAKTDAGILRDRGRDGQAQGDGTLEGGKSRFGDHWRSILSGSGNPGDRASADSASGEKTAADERTLSLRLSALLRLPAQAFERSGEAAGDREAPAEEAAQAGDGVDISSIIGALADAGKGAHAPSDIDGEKGNGHESRANSLDVSGPAAPDAASQALRDLAPQSTLPASGAAATPAAQASPPAASPARTTHEPALPAKARDAAGSEPDLHLSTRGEAGVPALKATVTHQATHFAPALGAGNIQALSSAITQLAGDLQHGAGRSAHDPASQQPGARPAGPVKTLTIQLTPISLGKVTIEMRMIGGAMKVDIQVADPKSLDLVRADKDQIMSLVRKAGIVPDSVTVTVQTADAASASKQNQTGQNATGQGANGSGYEREASRNGSGGSGARGDQDQGRMTHEDRSTEHSRLRGDIYL